MTPYILLTVHRRYNVLAANLRHIEKLKNEFITIPKIVVVRADPERKVDKLFEQWIFDGLITTVYERPPISPPTNITLEESLNINQANIFIHADRIKNGDNDPYFIIVQAGDCFAQPGIYLSIEYMMNHGCPIFGFKWKNHLRANGLHTNFFAINPMVCPMPVSNNNLMVLEVQFLQQILNRFGMAELNLPSNWAYLDNKDSKYFYHTHADITGNLLENLAENVNGYC